MLFSQSSDINELLQTSIIQVCQERFQGSKIEVDGIICISTSDESTNVVVKVHEVINDAMKNSDATKNQQAAVSPRNVPVKMNEVWMVNGERENEDGKIKKIPAFASANQKVIPFTASSSVSPPPNKHFLLNPLTPDTAGNNVRPSSTPSTPSKVQSSSINSMLMHLKPSEELICPECSSSCHGYVNYEQHNFNCHQLYTCHKCLQTFTMHSSLVSHLRHEDCKVGHGEENMVVDEKVRNTKEDTENKSKHILECKECGYVPQEPEDLNQHNLTQHNKYTCLECFATFSYQTNLYRHKKLHMSSAQLYRCLVCNKGYKRRELLQSHMFRHQVKGLFSCSLCPESFASQVSLVNHMKGKHGVKRMWMCLKCNMGFHSSLNYTQHAKTHVREKRIDRLQNFKLKTKADLLRAPLKSLKPIVSGLDLSRSTMIGTKIYPKMYRCHRCSGLLFRDLREYNQHMRMHEASSAELGPLSVKIEHASDEGSDADGPVDYSMKSTKNEGSLSTNSSLGSQGFENSPEPLVVNMEDESSTYDGFQDLANSPSAVEQENNEFVPHFRPNPEPSILTPVSSVSQGESAMMYTFSLGDKTPRGRPPKSIKLENVQLPKDALAVDLKDEHLFKHQAKFTCKWCDVSMGDFEIYTNHVAENHGRFVCPVCGDGFTVKSNLRRHLRNIHMVNNPNFKVCNLCGVEFNRSDSYKIHREKIHGIPLPNKRPKAPTVKQMITSTRNDNSSPTSQAAFPSPQYGRPEGSPNQSSDTEFDVNSPGEMMYSNSQCIDGDDRPVSRGSSLVGVTGEWSSVVGTGEWISSKTEEKTGTGPGAREEAVLADKQPLSTGNSGKFNSGWSASTSETGRLPCPDSEETHSGRESGRNTESDGTDNTDDIQADDTSTFLQEAQDIHQMICCTVCSAKYTSFNEYELHAESAHNTYPCRFCLKPFEMKISRNRHILQHRRVFPHLCGDCGMRFAKAEYLEVHVKDACSHRN